IIIGSGATRIGEGLTTEPDGSGEPLLLDAIKRGVQHAISDIYPELNINLSRLMTEDPDFEYERELRAFTPKAAIRNWDTPAEPASAAATSTSLPTRPKIYLDVSDTFALAAGGGRFEPHEIALRKIVSEETNGFSRISFISETIKGLAMFNNARKGENRNKMITGELPVERVYRYWTAPFMGKLHTRHFERLVKDWEINESFFEIVGILREKLGFSQDEEIEITIESGNAVQINEAICRRPDAKARLEELNVKIIHDGISLIMGEDGYYTGRMISKGDLWYKNPEHYPVGSIIIGDETMVRYGFADAETCKATFLNAETFDREQVESVLSSFAQTLRQDGSTSTATAEVTTYSETVLVDPNTPSYNELEESPSTAVAVAELAQSPSEPVLSQVVITDKSGSKVVIATEEAVPATMKAKLKQSVGDKTELIFVPDVSKDPLTAQKETQMVVGREKADIGIVIDTDDLNILNIDQVRRNIRTLLRSVGKDIEDKPTLEDLKALEDVIAEVVEAIEDRRPDAYIHNIISNKDLPKDTLKYLITSVRSLFDTLEPIDFRTLDITGYTVTASPTLENMTESMRQYGLDKLAQNKEENFLVITEDVDKATYIESLDRALQENLGVSLDSLYRPEHIISLNEIDGITEDNAAQKTRDYIKKNFRGIGEIDKITYIGGDDYYKEIINIALIIRGLLSGEPKAIQAALRILGDKARGIDPEALRRRLDLKSHTTDLKNYRRAVEEVRQAL
ncbi:MAG: hypothetical protein ABID54_11180, partial [Pseudomonadota bacterium]